MLGAILKTNYCSIETLIKIWASKMALFVILISTREEENGP